MMLRSLLGTAPCSPKLSPPPPPPKKPSLVARCQLDSGSEKKDLTIGSPIVVVAAPPMLKTAAAMPSLRVNSGLVKEGDVGRIIARKPKDVWAVRLAIGTYLLDGKYFKPLDLDE